MKMNSELKQLIQEFEKEVWLFLDEDLSENRMEFWKLKLKEIPELNNYIEDYMLVSELYNETKDVELDVSKFNSMIDVALNTDSFLNKVRRYFSNLFSSESEFVFGKIAFASVLIIAAVSISIISNRPNPVINMTNTINAKLLDWDAEFVDNQINKVGNLLKLTKDDEYRKYYKYKLATKNVDKNINLINTNIEKLKAEINNKEL